MTKAFHQSYLFSFHFAPTDPGTHWTKDPQVALDANHPYCDRWVLTPCALPLPQGGYRLYYMGGSHEQHEKGVGGGILSASSGKAKDWQRDPLYRLEPLLQKNETWVLCPDVIPLSGGGYRMFFQVQSPDHPDRILSAFSKDTLNWDREPGIRIGDDSSHYGSPRCLPLPDGRYRLYFHRYPTPDHPRQDKEILSAISDDGVRFNIEEGVRIAQETELETESVYAADVLQIGTGGYRMYYAAWTANPKQGRILSAFSNDGLNWTKDKAICIDIGGQWDQVKASEPSVVPLENGTYRMLYEACDDKGQWRILSATSTDKS